MKFEYDSQLLVASSDFIGRTFPCFIAILTNSNSKVKPSVQCNGRSYERSVPEDELASALGMAERKQNSAMERYTKHCFSGRYLGSSPLRLTLRSRSERFPRTIAANLINS